MPTVLQVSNRSRWRLRIGISSRYCCGFQGRLSGVALCCGYARVGPLRLVSSLRVILVRFHSGRADREACGSHPGTHNSGANSSANSGANSSANSGANSSANSGANSSANRGGNNNAETNGAANNSGSRCDPATRWVRFTLVIDNGR
jgi:hypothetical protein